MPPRVPATASLAAVRAYLRDLGEGATFTTLQMREAIPNVNQVDRRMRELRAADPVPWVIHSSQTRSGLPTDTYLLERIGSDTLPKKVSSRVRREVLEAAGNRCQVCGIGVGEEYAEYPGERARLQLGHWRALDQGGSATERSNLRAECHRCNGGVRNRTGALADRAIIEARARALPRKERDRLLLWLERGQREQREDEQLCYQAQQLPPSELSLVIAFLRSFGDTHP